LRAKASHGYDDETMRAFAPALAVTSESIERNWVLVAERDGIPLGFAHVERRDDPAIAWLEDLFVDPDSQRQGIGRLLWEAAFNHARTTGATEIRLDADPYATTFYERLGAVVVGAIPSTFIPGRTTPLMRYGLEAGHGGKA